MDRPSIHIDFNEMIEPGLYTLSHSDTTRDSAGTTIQLAEGIHVGVYDDDDGSALIADAIVERNTSPWSTHVKWFCRIDRSGIRRWPDNG